MKNISIKIAFLSISILILVMSLLGGFSSVMGLKSINDGAIYLSTKAMPAVINAEQMDIALVNVRLAGAQIDLASTPQELATAEKNLSDNVKNFSALLQSYTETVSADNKEELHTLEALKGDFEKYKAMDEKYITLLKTDKVTEAKEIFNGQLLELHHTIEGEISTLVKDNIDYVHQVDQKNQGNYNQVSTTVTLLSSLISLFCVFLIGLVVWGLAKPMGQMVASMLA